jgi:tetratricopeptide (TPR) repeat protein
VKTPASVASPADLSRASQVEEPVAATSKKAKQPFIAKLNPVNWFRSRDGNERPSTPSAAERTSNPVSATSGIETSRTPDPGTRSAPPPQTGFSGPRYTYHSFPTPAAGRRAEAEKWLNDGVKARERNRPKDAVDAFRMSASADPSFFEAFYNLGVTAYEVGDRPRALIAYEQALSLNPDSMKARYNFAIVLEKAGYPQDAAEELERLLIKSPSEAAAHLTLGNLYAGYSGELEKARQHYRKFLELQPQSTQATTIRYWLEAHP